MEFEVFNHRPNLSTSQTTHCSWCSTCNGTDYAIDSTSPAPPGEHPTFGCLVSVTWAIRSTLSFVERTTHTDHPDFSIPALSLQDGESNAKSIHSQTRNEEKLDHALDNVSATATPRSSSSAARLARARAMYFLNAGPVFSSIRSARGFL